MANHQISCQRINQASILQSNNMAKKKRNTSDANSGETEPSGTSAKSERKQVGIDPVLYRDIAVLASLELSSVPDYVNNRMRPIVDAELLQRFGTTDI